MFWAWFIVSSSTAADGQESRSEEIRAKWEKSIILLWWGKLNRNSSLLMQLWWVIRYVVWCWMKAVFLISVCTSLGRNVCVCTVYLHLSPAECFLFFFFATPSQIPSQCMTCVAFQAVREYIVGKTAPVPVKIYDYYEPGVPMMNILSTAL